MIPDAEIWRAALLMVKRYGDDAGWDEPASAGAYLATKSAR